MQTPSASDSAAADLRAYRAGIQRAIERGLITYSDLTARSAHDLFAHYTNGAGWAWKPTNTPPLCPSAAAILRQLRHRPRLRILELGLGAGVAAAKVRAIVHDRSLTTIGLTPINPFWRPGKTCGYALERPFIDLQLVGDLEDMLPRAGRPYDFIYDNFRAIFWKLFEARQDPLRADRVVSSVLERLHEAGTLFVGASDGARLLERSLDRNTHAVQHWSGPIFTGVEICTCILTQRGRVR